jgi:secreted PhoX family phosphatase
MDRGTLYVARFNEDGSGDWLPLDINNAGFQAAAAAAGVEFKDQADVLVNTRLAADVVGATKMDRPEWGAVHPQTREVYMTLTNNTARTVTDAPPIRADRTPPATSSAGASRAIAPSPPSSSGTSLSRWAGPTDSQVLPARTVRR